MKRLAFLFTALAFAGAAHANLIANGSFEQGTAGIGSFTGWTTNLSDIDTFVDSSGLTSRRYGDATDGLWSAFFGSTRDDGPSTISQTFATVAGQRYVVSFDLANDNGGFGAVNAFSASIDGSALFSVSNLVAQDYLRESFVFTATGATTLFSLGGFNDNGFFDLDAVVVAALPEPSEEALLAAGGFALAGLVVARRKR